MEAGFEQLYNTYYMQVYSFVVAQTRNQALAEEITQRTFFKALTSQAAFRGESAAFTWLCAIAKRLLADEARAAQRISSLPAEPEAVDIGPEQALLNEDSVFRIHQALHELDEPYKEVFQLRVFGELPFAQIGRLFNKTENWARVTFHRARLKIQERMEDE